MISIRIHRFIILPSQYLTVPFIMVHLQKPCSCVFINDKMELMRDSDILRMKRFNIMPDGPRGLSAAKTGEGEALGTVRCLENQTNRDFLPHPSSALRETADAFKQSTGLFDPRWGKEFSYLMFAVI